MVVSIFVVVFMFLFVLLGFDVLTCFIVLMSGSFLLFWVVIVVLYCSL